jgi:hypothetical protein
MARKSRVVAKRAGKLARVATNKTYRVLVEISPHETVRNLGAFHLDHCCMPQPRDEKTGGRRVHAYAQGSTIVALRQAGRKVEVLADAMVEGKRMQKLVGKGDRFQGGRRGPAGIGKLV